MKKIALFLVIGVVGLILISFLFTADTNYKETILLKRELLLDYMKRSSDSPFIGLSKPKGLIFFEVDERFRVFASGEKVEEKTRLVIQKTKGESTTYLKIMLLKFSLEDVLYTLYVYQNEENESDLLLPFSDLTNGHEI